LSVIVSPHNNQCFKHNESEITALESEAKEGMEIVLADEISALVRRVMI
jgi:hypothetical protein